MISIGNKVLNCLKSLIGNHRLMIHINLALFVFSWFVGFVFYYRGLLLPAQTLWFSSSFYLIGAVSNHAIKKIKDSNRKQEKNRLKKKNFSKNQE